jgi:5-methylcytosine-specific restriction endonuclease McrA
MTHSEDGSGADESCSLVPRNCLFEPISEIWTAALLLRKAVDAHSSGETRRAEALFREADIPAITRWTELVWGPRRVEIHRVRHVPNTPPILPKDKRPQPRMPTVQTQLLVKQRDGFFCRFCGIPVIDPSVRARIRVAYPDAVRWGEKNMEQHAAFQCMWLQYDHVLPNSRGGDSSHENIIVTCAPCNFGRAELTLNEVGLLDPRMVARAAERCFAAKWKGLEDFALKPL